MMARMPRRGGAGGPRPPGGGAQPRGAPPAAARGDGHAARVIARREGDDAALALFGRELQQPVGCAPQLERAASLQAFALDPDAGAADLAFEQRGTLHEAADPLRCCDHIIPADAGCSY